MKLVYIKGLKGSEPQKWPYEMPFYYASRPILQSFDVKPGEEKLDIDELTKRYPLTVGDGSE